MPPLHVPGAPRQRLPRLAARQRRCIPALLLGLCPRPPQRPGLMQMDWTRTRSGSLPAGSPCLQTVPSILPGPLAPTFCVCLGNSQVETSVKRLPRCQDWERFLSDSSPSAPHHQLTACCVRWGIQASSLAGPHSFVSLGRSQRNEARPSEGVSRVSRPQMQPGTPPDPLAAYGSAWGASGRRILCTPQPQGPHTHQHLEESQVPVSLTHYSPLSSSFRGEFPLF